LVPKEERKFQRSKYEKISQEIFKAVESILSSNKVSDNIYKK